MTDSTFVDNSSPYGGGIYYAGSAAGNTIGILLASDSTFTGNSATYDGGGGGIWNQGTATVTNCTIDGNAGQDGGICNATTSTLTLDNTIVAGNSGPDIVGSVQPTSKNNLIGDGTGITNLTELDPSNLVGTTADPLNPMLGPLANNGGPTQTMALLPGSPAIDAGSVALAVDASGNSLTTDQRGAGFPRIMGGTVDIGAYEFFISQTISFGPLGGQTYGVAPITLNATASSDLPVSYTVITGPATISGNVLTVTGAGNVEVEADQAGNTTYDVATPVDESFTVASALLTITPKTGQSMVYRGAVPVLTYTYTGLVNGDTSATFSGGLATTATSSSSVGDYPITVGTLAATGNYTIGTFNPGTLTVNAAALTITANNDSKTYGTLKTFSGTAFTESGLVNGDTITGVTETSTGAPASAPVGTYNIVPSAATGTGLSNYTITYINGTLTVNAAALTITANNDSKTYGTLKTFSGTAFTETGLVTANGDTITGVTETSTGAAASATVGTYNIVPSAATGTGLSNYTIGYVNGTLTVNAATLTITANNDSKTYGTLKTFSSTAFTETGLVTANGDTITGVTETSTGAAASATVGTYNIVPSAATGNRLSNYTIGYVNGTLTVNAALLTITPKTGQSMVYGGAVPVLIYTYTGLVNGDTSATFSGGLATTATSSSSVGGYPITVGTLAATGNYTIGTFNPGTLTVNAAALTITANNDSKTYGTLKTFSGTAFTASGLVNGDTITGVTETSTGAGSSTTLGTYPIVPSAATGTGLSNYTIGYVNGTLTVNPATLTITANNDSKTYGTLKTFSSTAFTETGLVNGDTITGVTETSTGAPASATVGTYNIVPSAATGNRLSNYTIGYVNGTLTVNAALLTITPKTGQSMVYGGAVPVLIYTYTGLVNGDTSATFSGGLATTATSSSSVGGYPITVGTLAATGNYTIGTFNPGTLTVNAAALTITANNDSKTYGTLKTFSATAFTETGLVTANGDTITGVTETSTGAAASATVGTYNIVPSAATGNRLSNYTIGYVNGTLTVNPATLTITANNDSKTYGTLKTFSATAFTETGLVTANGDTITGVTETSTGAPALATVGTYNIVSSAATGNRLSNYTIGYVNGTLTVNPATLTITANNDSKTYGTLKTFGATAFTETGLVTANGDTITGVTETSTGAPASATVGTYNIVSSAATGSRLSNYTIGYVNGTLTVNPATLTITANNDSKTYGTLKTFSATAFTETGLVTANGDTITGVTETSTGAAASATVGDLQHRSQRRDGQQAEQLRHRLRQRHADRRTRRR